MAHCIGLTVALIVALCSLTSPSSSLADQSHDGLGLNAAIPAWAAHQRVHFLRPASQAGETTGGGLTEQDAFAAPHNDLGQSKGADPPLLYHGGTGVQHNPVVYVIFWGTAWNSEPGYALRAQLEKMYEGLYGSSYEGILTQYFDATGRVSLYPNRLFYTDYEKEGKEVRPTLVNDTKIQEEIASLLKTKEVTEGWRRELRSQFVVIPAPGSTYEAGFGKKFCAYHSFIAESEASHDYTYTFVPDIADEPFRSGCSGYDKNKITNNVTSMVASHEYSESATDPALDTWFTKEGWELGDICASGDDEIKEGSLAGSWVQGEWDDHQSGETERHNEGCSLSDPAPPYVYAIAEPATGVTTTGATLNGIVNPEGLETKYHFEYGTTTSYGTKTAEVIAGAGTSNVSAAKAITSLGEGVTYHYRLVATNSTGTTDSMDRTFTTPTVETTATAGIGAHSAELTGVINPSGEETTYHFEYGESPAYGTKVPVPDINIGSGKTSITVTGSIMGLKRFTTYHARLVAANSGGAMYGSDVTFTTVRGGGSWLLNNLPISESVATSWKGKMALNKGGGVVECEDTAEGQVAPNDTGEVTKWTMSKCAGVTICESGSTLEALHLPWHTELVAVEGAARDVLSGTGHSEPGFKRICKVYGVNVEELCTAPTLNSTTTNGASGVTATFNSSDKITCSGEQKGTAEGVQTIEATKGGKLGAAPEAEWRVGGAMLTESAATVWKGKTKLSDTNGSAVECEDAAEGPVTPGNAGEVTKVTMSKCVGLGANCESKSTLEALHLPWHSELVAVEGTTRDVLKANGHGEPGYKLTCEVFGAYIPEECTGSPVLTATNGASGVTATFLANEKLKCEGTNKIVYNGTLEDTQTIEAAKGGKLSAVNATEAGKLSEAEWRIGGATLTESAATVWKGKTKLSDTNGAAVECEDAAEGPVTPGNAGEVTKVTMSKCVGLGANCESKSTLEALHLPWRSELVAVEGTTREVLKGSGHGEPGYKLTCEVFGAYIPEECTGSPVLTTTNGASGVTATFLASEKVKCEAVSKAIYTGTLEDTQTIEAAKGGKLEAT